MTGFVWILKDVLLAIHSEQLAEHGGRQGIRDEGMLDSALARPRNLAGYDSGADVMGLAVAYTFGLAKNHPFVDGNKRVAFVAGELFLALNGYELTAGDADCVMTMLAVADGSMPEEALALWYRENSVRQV